MSVVSVAMDAMAANRDAAEYLSMQLKAFESLLFRARAALRGCVEAKGVAS